MHDCVSAEPLARWVRAGNDRLRCAPSRYPRGCTAPSPRDAHSPPHIPKRREGNDHMHERHLATRLDRPQAGQRRGGSGEHHLRHLRFRRLAAVPRLPPHTRPSTATYDRSQREQPMTTTTAGSTDGARRALQVHRWRTCPFQGGTDANRVESFAGPRVRGDEDSPATLPRRCPTDDIRVSTQPPRASRQRVTWHRRTRAKTYSLTAPTDQKGPTRVHQLRHPRLGNLGDPLH